MDELYDTEPVTRLYPLPATCEPLRGLYLAHDLRGNAHATRPFVYTNFIASLDGRISEPGPDPERHRRVPTTIANVRDWRLYLELLAQADIVLTSAAHLRAVAAGRQAALLGLDGPAGEGLAAWRHARGLARAPAVAVVSAELRIPEETIGRADGGPLLVLTHRDVADGRAAALERHGVEVLRIGAAPWLTAAEIIEALAVRGYRCIYSIAGPRMLHTLLAGDLVDRLYLTVAQMLLGGAGDTLMPDVRLPTPAAFVLQAAYLDAHGPHGAGQMFLTLARPAHRAAVDAAGNDDAS